MRFSVADTKAYPKLAYYIKNDLPKIIDDPVIVSAMSKIGQINKTKLKQVLKWGQGPTIKVIPLMGECGEFSPGINSQEIRIDERMVKEFEQGKGKRSAKAGKVYVVGITILHELIHWGDDQDGIDRPGEEGEKFERMVYGSVINC